VDNQGEKIHWIEVKLKTDDGEIAEALAEVLGRFASNGVVVESETNFNPHTEENEPTGGLIVSGYLAVDEDVEQKVQKLNEAFWHLGRIAPIPQPEYSHVRDENWMAAWKKHYTPVPIGKNILIMPAWKEPGPNEDRITIKINPAMAFGTGTHPSTQLCLKMMERHLKPGENVIDVGCGSGILSIAALKMGAAHALAVDIDSQAITATLENAQLNNITSTQLETGKGSVEEILTGRFTLQEAPLVLVNILAPIIIRLFGLGLADLVRDGGKILLSGLLDHQEKDVLAAASQAGFRPTDRLTDADWVSLAMVKRGDSR